MSTILVTGAAGFIGRALCRGLAARGHRPVAGLRHPAPPPGTSEGLLLGDITPQRDWSRALRGVGIEVIVHLAQRAHSTADPAALAPEPAAAAELARAAARAGIHRFVYVSSITAMGAATAPGRPFRADDEARPETPYGHSKLATERALGEAARDTGIQMTIVRPPLVYGPEARGNFARLARLAASGVPLPLGGIDNRRSLIFVDNLVDLLAVAADHPLAAGRVLLVADGRDLSTPDLVRAIAEGQGRKVRLFRVPPAILAPLHPVPVIGPAIARLTLSLQVDDGATRALLGWTPPSDPETALRETARALLPR